MPRHPYRGQRRLWPCLAVVAAFTCAAPRAHAGNNVPDWVKTAAASELPHLPESTKAVVLLEEETYTVGADGRATEHVREVIKILRPQGRRLAEPVIWYDKDSKIAFLHVWSIDPAGHEYALKDNDIQDVGSYGGMDLYSDDRAKVASPPGLDPGGVIGYEFERRERPYLAEANWDFQDELPRIHQSFTLVLPPGFEYTTTWAHHAKVEPAQTAPNTFTWQLDGEKAIDLDRVPLSPAVRSLASRFTVHYAGPGLPQPQEGTWKGIGEWYAALSRDRLAASSDIAAKAAELTAGKTDFYDKAEAIGDYVQSSIRYVAIEVGVGGFQPHAADAVFHGGYGDCKDKATLLSAMLSTVGIHSALLMVDTERGVVNPENPSIVGNHMIAAIEIPKGYDSPKLHSVVTAATGRRYLIFDPTWEETPFGQLENNLQGSYGVLMEGPDSQVIQLPIMDPQLNRIQRSGTFQLSADGTLKGDVTVKRYGDDAEDWREIFTREDARKQQEVVDNSVGRDLVAVSVSGLQVQNTKQLNQDLTVRFNLEAGHFASATGPLLMVRPRVLGSEAFEIDHKQRKILIDMGETLQAKDDFNIQLPDGYTIDELPDPVKADFGFATYESSTTLEGHTLHYTRTYTLKQVTLPPDQYPQLQKLDELIASDEDSRAVLKRTAATQ